MVPAEALRNKILNRLPVKFRLCVTEKFRRTRVRATDHPIGIRDKNRVGRNLEQILQRELSELGPFLLGHSRCVLFRGIRRSQGVGPCEDSTRLDSPRATRVSLFHLISLGL